jgi:hypothetical protein
VLTAAKHDNRNMTTTKTLPALGSTCTACGDEIEQSDRGRPRKFCDSTCRSAWRRMVEAASVDPTPPCSMNFGAIRCTRPAVYWHPDFRAGACTEHRDLATHVHQQISKGPHDGPTSDYPAGWNLLNPWRGPNLDRLVGTYAKGSWSW